MQVYHAVTGFLSRHCLQIESWWLSYCPEAGNELPAFNTRCPFVAIHQPRNLLSVFMASLQSGTMPFPSCEPPPPDRILVGVVLP